MISFISRRLLQAIPVMFGVLVLAFAVTRLTPGDPAVIMAGLEASDEAVEAIRRDLGLDKPIITQFGIYVWNVLQGDLGRSFFLGRNVTTLILTALGLTIQLTVVALAITVVVGIPLGIISAIRKDTFTDLAARGGALIGVSIPPFFAGLVAILIFSHYVNWFPSFGVGSWRHLILPGITLSLFSTGLIMRLTRSAMLDVLNQDYIRTARGKGLAERAVLYSHALRNAGISIVTVMGLQLGSLLAGAVLVETVFSYPGVGRLLVDSIFARDFPIIQGVILVVALMYVLVNLGVDLIYSVIDPRIRYQ